MVTLKVTELVASAPNEQKNHTEQTNMLFYPYVLLEVEGFMFINITSKNEYINGKSVAQPGAPITIKF